MDSEPLGERERFIVLSPEGSGRPSQFNIGIARPDNPDVIFIRSMLDEVGAAACVDMARFEGILGAPEGGAGLAAITRLIAQGKISRHESVVLFNTGSGYKYLEAWQAALGQ